MIKQIEFVDREHGDGDLGTIVADTRVIQQLSPASDQEDTGESGRQTIKDNRSREAQAHREPVSPRS
jgi:hypothetical protein